ncbi:phage tail protein [Klebsiella michiganensis]|uniref:phage tail protein n=1 Tax=Klebsiella michiganensis TaxID=1134687 RepID=UPI00197D196D|nr:phage tail protein [Klebsiella michiganensis]MBN4041410.1 phage tail protein [Klebsiella michiganensis]
MAQKKYFSLLTQKGMDKFAAASLDDTSVGFAYMSIGDGNGVVPVPDINQTGLVNETYRSRLNSVKIAESEENIIIAEMIIPPENGGYTIREAALFDEEGACLAVASLPETYKPKLDDGAGKFSVIRVWVSVTSAADVTLINDPGIIIATEESVLEAKNTAMDYTDEQLTDHEKSVNHPDASLTGKGFTQLSNATDSDSENVAATPAAVRAAIQIAIRSAWELDNPVGTTRFFSNTLNPNIRWPWTTWVYTGENKTIRVAKADGSNVGKTGGSDTVTLQQANLPAVQINVSGETSESQRQELTTRKAGRHKHRGGMLAPGEVWDDNYVVGSDNDSHRTRNYTDEADDHDHIVDLPSHKHTTSGKTGNLGEGQALNIVEAHTLLMCWSRTA